MERYFLILCFLLVSSNAWSQEQLIRVQTIGVGTTEAEAVTDAQINALKLSYQTFLSSDLTVVNDQIVNDEIASLVSGTIKNFKVLSTFEGDMGLWEANIDATLTQGNLVRFAEAIGDEVKVQGALFGAEIKQQNLNKANEIISVQHLLKKAGFFRDFFDVSLSEPTSPKKESGTRLWGISLPVSVTANENFEQLAQLVWDTLDAIGLSDDEADKYLDMQQDLYMFTVCRNPRYFYSVSFSTYSRTDIWDPPGEVATEKRSSRSGKNKRPPMECLEVGLRNAQSVIALYGLEEIVRKDLDNYMVYSEFPDNYNSPSIYLSSVADALGIHGYKPMQNVYESQTFPTLHDANPNSRDSRKRSVRTWSCKSLSSKGPLDACSEYFISDSTSSVPFEERVFSFSNKFQKYPIRHIISGCRNFDQDDDYEYIDQYVYPCYRNLKYVDINRTFIKPSYNILTNDEWDGIVDINKDERYGMDISEQLTVFSYGAGTEGSGVNNILIFPLQGDSILNLYIAHSMTEEELGVLSGYKLQTASETYNKKQLKEIQKQPKNEEKSWWQW